MIPTIRESVKEKHPLIHCITNPISINQCANALLAVGARPMMAEHPKEVEEITGTADALMLNLGNITDVRMESMMTAAKTAKAKGTPIVLDAVGVACSTLRRNFALALIDTAMPTVIKGNYSEILALCRESYRSSGVDAEATLTETAIGTAAAEFARQYGCIIIASGKTDIVTDGDRLFRIHNGTDQLASVTGTGCMLGAICAAYLSARPDVSAAVAACAVLGIAGEYAQTERGMGSFMVSLMDALSTLQDANIIQDLKMEERPLEQQ